MRLLLDFIPAVKTPRKIRQEVSRGPTLPPQFFHVVPFASPTRRNAKSSRRVPRLRFVARCLLSSRPRVISRDYRYIEYRRASLSPRAPLSLPRRREAFDRRTFARVFLPLLFERATARVNPGMSKSSRGFSAFRAVSLRVACTKHAARGVGKMAGTIYPEIMGHPVRCGVSFLHRGGTLFQL